MLLLAAIGRRRSSGRSVVAALLAIAMAPVMPMAHTAATTATPTSTTVTVSPSPGTDDDVITISAAVQPNPGAGSAVDFLVVGAGYTRKEQTLVNSDGIANFGVLLAFGTYEVTVSFPGTDAFGPSTSETITHQVWPRQLSTIGFDFDVEQVYAFQRVPFSAWADPNPGGGTLQVRDGHYTYSDKYAIDPASGRATGNIHLRTGTYRLSAHLADSPVAGRSIGCEQVVQPALRPAEPVVSADRTTFSVGEVARFEVDVFDPAHLPGLEGVTTADLHIEHESRTLDRIRPVDVASGRGTAGHQFHEPGRYDVFVTLPAYAWATSESPHIQIEVLPGSQGQFPALPAPATGAAATTISFTALPETIWKGETVTFTARIEPQPTGGEVILFDGSEQVTSLWPTGAGTYVSSAWPVKAGDHRYRVLYFGSPANAPAASDIQTRTVQSIPTTLSLGLSGDEVDTMTPVTLTATVDPVPSGGYVRLFRDGVPHGFGPLNSGGQATWTDVWPDDEGTPHVITAVVEFAGRYATSFADGVQLSVERVQTSVTLDGPSSVPSGGSFFNVSVEVEPFIPDSRPLVEIWVGDQLLSQRSIDEPQQQLSVRLPPGGHSLRARYLEGAVLAPSFSNVLDVVIGPYADRKGISGTLAVNGGNPYVSNKWVLLQPELASTSYPASQFQVSNDGQRWATFGFDPGVSNAFMWDVTNTACGGTPGDGAHRIFYRWTTSNDFDSSPVESVDVTISPEVNTGLTLDRVDPSATAPEASQAGSGLAGGAATTSLSLVWSGSDDRSGVGAYELQQQTDGGSWSGVAVANPQATATSVSVPVDHTYRFRVRARDRAGNVGVWATSAAVPTTVTRDSVAPAASPPKVSLATAVGLGSSVKASVTWPLATDNVGVVAYEVQRRTNTGTWTNVSLPSATSTRVDQALALGTNRYTYRVRARDAAGNTSSWAAGAAFMLSRLQEKAAGIAYNAGWKRVALSGASGGYVRKATLAGRTATLTFTGQGVAFATTLGPNRGKARIWLDGVNVATIDLYSATTKKAWLAYAAQLPSATHTLRIEVTGTKRSASTGTRVDVDAFVVVR